MLQEPLLFIVKVREMPYFELVVMDITVGGVVRGVPTALL